MKIKPDQQEEMQHDAVETAKREEPRRLARAGITNRQYKDYELYMPAEEELMLATVDNKEDKDEEVLVTVAH